jgi:hypothetical protein
VGALAAVYRPTKDLRVRTRAQIVLRAGAQRLRGAAIAQSVPEAGQPVRSWWKR